MMLGKVLIRLIPLHLTLSSVLCEIAWMCSEWPKTVKCSDTQHVVINNVQFQTLPKGMACKTDEGLPSSQPIRHQDASKCDDVVFLLAANKLCSGQSECVLSQSRLSGDSCYWPENKKLEIQYTCLSIFVCPKSVTGLTANAFTKNLHKRPAAWAHDIKWHVDSVFLLPWMRHGGTRTLYEYPSLERFKATWPFVKYHLPVAAASTAMALCDGMMFYVKHQTRHLVKYNLVRKQIMTERALPNAYYNGEASYDIREGGGSDIDLAMDEGGLWAIYSTSENHGNVVISQIHMEDLRVMQTWLTKVKKSSLINSFVVCGEIYFINQQREIFKKFDTAGNTTSTLPISSSMTLPWHNVTSINYNPRDGILYVWSLREAMMFMLANDKDSVSETKVQRQHSISFTTFTSTFTTKSYNMLYNATCPEMIRNGVKFPSVSANTQVMISCPKEPKYLVQWDCKAISDALAVWSSSGPDFASCLEWAKSIKEDIMKNDATMASNKLLQTIRTQRILNAGDGFTNVDVAVASSLLRNLSRIDDNHNHKQTTAAEYLHVYKNLLEASDEIMNLNLSSLWHTMEKNEKSNVFTNILSSLETSAFQYAEKMQMEKQRSEFTIESESVDMSVQIIENSNSKDVYEEIIFSLGNSTSETEKAELSLLDVRANSNNGSSKVVFAVYKNFDKLLNEQNVSELSDVVQINSHIVTLSISDADKQIKLRQPVKLTLKHTQESNKEHSCVFWKPGNSTTVGSWGTSGCRVATSNLSHTVCECDHLTSFAVLMNHQNFVLSHAHTVALDYITWIGLTTSLICLALSIATFLYFKSLHCLRTTIHTNLCICLFLSQLIFLTAIDLHEFETVCSVVAGVLHYTFLATFTWMALEGFQLYVMLVEVFERFTSVVWYYLIGYGLPAVFVTISASVNHNGYGTDRACWLSTELGGSVHGLMPFIWAFIGPASFVAVANIFFLVLTAVTIYTHARKYIYFSKIRAAKSSLCGTCALLCLLGSSWIFGIIWWWKNLIVIHYLFCTFNAFQGVYIFIFHCILHNKVRYEYRNFLSQCFGEKYFDNTTTSSLSIKYNGSRRSHTHYQQKWRRDSSSIPTVYEKHAQTKHPLSKRRKSAPSIGPAKRDHGSMQAIVTRKNSITYLHSKMFYSPESCKAQGGFFAQRHYSLCDRRSLGDIARNKHESANPIMTRHSMKAVVNSCSNLVEQSSTNHSSPSRECKNKEVKTFTAGKFHSLENLQANNQLSNHNHCRSMPKLDL